MARANASFTHGPQGWKLGADCAEGLRPKPTDSGFRIPASALLCALLTAPAAAQLDHPNLKLGSHESALLGKKKEYYIYVPPTEDPAERFPVVYVLHGKWGAHNDWPERGQAAAVAQRYRMILVFPDGEQFSWYLDSPVMPESQYFSYITEELPAHIDATYPTVASREGRAIMGLSMGGHGALNAAAKRPELYASASSLSGVLRLANHPDREDVAERLGPMDEFPGRWMKYSVYDIAPLFADNGVQIMFDCGEDDTKTKVIYDNRDLHARLTELNIPHIWREHPGTHSWEYWTEHLPEHLNFHQAAMIEAQEQPRWVQHYFRRLAEFYAENAAFELEQPAGDTVLASLLGSSGIEGLRPELLPETLPDGTPLRFFNRGIGSDRLGIDARGLSRRLEVSVFDFSPHVVIISNGTNDIGELHRSADGQPTITRMAEEYQEIVRTIKSRLPETAILITACPPVTGRFSHLADSLVALNAELERIAEEEGASFVDLHAATVGEDGLLKEEYSADGLHFTRAGKVLAVDMILQALAGAVTAP